MKFTLYTTRQLPTEYWNGKQTLPSEIHVASHGIGLAEFQLLALLCGLHGKISPYDLLTGCESDTEKDKDLIAILTAFQWYVYPRMPLSSYTSTGGRIRGGDKRSGDKQSSDKMIAE